MRLPRMPRTGAGQGKLQQAGNLLLLILFFIIVFIVIGIIVYCFVKALKKLVPPPDPTGHTPPPLIGTRYAGGIVIGNGGYGPQAEATKNFTLTIYSQAEPMLSLADTLTNPVVYQQSFSGTYVDDALNEMWNQFVDGLQVEALTNPAPMHFYNFVISNAPAIQ